MKKKKR